MQKVALNKVKKRRGKNLLSIVPGIIFLLGSLSLVFRHSPNDFLQYERLSVPVLPVFIILFSFGIFFFVAFLGGRIQGIIFLTFFLIYATLSILNLNSIFFLVLLVALLAVTELFIYKKQ